MMWVREPARPQVGGTAKLTLGVLEIGATGLEPAACRRGGRSSQAGSPLNRSACPSSEPLIQAVAKLPCGITATVIPIPRGQVLDSEFVGQSNSGVPV